MEVTKMIKTAVHQQCEIRGRQHETPIGVLPGVTTVLGKTKDTYFLKQWKDRVGEEQANKITNLAIDRGNNLHKFVEDYYLKGSQETPICEYSENQETLESMATTILPYIQTIRPLFIERATWHPYGFAGSCDMVGVKDNKVTIFDWKNSLKKKKREYISDYLLQAAAYSMSVEYTLDTKVEECIVVVVYMTGKNTKLEEFKLDSHDIPLVQKAFLRRLDKYQKDFGTW